MLLYIKGLLSHFRFLHLHTNDNWNGDFVVITSKKKLVRTLLKQH